MDSNERKGWTLIVTPNDLDKHMADIGQAEVNANLVVEMLQNYPLRDELSLLVPGCGTGQMFDYIKPNQLGNYGFTFTDIKLKFLEKLDIRLSKYPNTKYRVVLDDIEETRFIGTYDGILSVLLLQHIDWKKGVDSMVNFNPFRMYFVIQEQGNTEHAVTKSRNLTKSMAEFAEIANPQLVPKEELTDYLMNNNYKLLKTHEVKVPNNKTMVGMVFEEK